MLGDEIKEKAIAFARDKRKKIARAFADVNKCPSVDTPISIFMAGSPGAGKTEFSKNLITVIENGAKMNVLRIDGDEFRKQLPGYTGSNSSLFQTAITLIIEKIHDTALKQKQSFILDGTLSNRKKAIDNIHRSLAKGRLVFVFYVFQDPKVAWDFTLKREKVEGRNIPKDAFIEHFFNAKTSVQVIRNAFGEAVYIYIVMKDSQKNEIEKIEEIKPGSPPIDDCIGKSYTKNILEDLL